MDKDQSIKMALDAFEEKRHEFSIFMNGVSQWFSSHPKLCESSLPIVHSVKTRLKDGDHLREKISRKWDDADPINPENIFEKGHD